MRSRPTCAVSMCDRDPLPVTEALATQTIGLPCSIDLSRRDIGRVCAALAEVMGMAARRGEPAGMPAASSLRS